jgi:hypothetical protein
MNINSLCLLSLSLSPLNVFTHFPCWYPPDDFLTDLQKKCINVAARCAVDDEKISNLVCWKESPSLIADEEKKECEIKNWKRMGIRV